MNKLNALALAGLILSTVNSAFSMGNEQKEILYALHNFKQPFASVPMIAENIDMFIGIMGMSTQMTEQKLASANQKFKTALWKNGALFVGAVANEVMVDYTYNYLGLTKNIASLLFLRGVYGLASIGEILVSLNIHNAWKTRESLREALALDKEILEELQELKMSLMQNSEPTNLNLLENMPQGNVENVQQSNVDSMLLNN
ncbi:MAG TPA: hypothetical protein VLB80_00260 [Candidatus Babeliales bacterium]|nr:hypothetical protein [Candidatus Babeliales bacterium]